VWSESFARTLKAVEEFSKRPEELTMPDIPAIPGYVPFDPKNPQDINISGASLLNLYNLLPPKWQNYFAIAIGVIGLLIGFIGGHNAPRPVTPVEVTVPEVKIAPLAPATKTSYYITAYYLTKADDALVLLKGLPSGTVETYPVGSVYNFKGTILPMPVVATKDASGIDIDVKVLK